MNLPKISNYGEYYGDNYGVHSLMVNMGEFNLYYSYETIVAYYDDEDGLVVTQNQWKTTTGKHLNKIQSDKKLRIPYPEFQEKLEAMLQRHIK